MIALGILGMALALVAACSDSDGSGPLTAAEAEEIASQALLIVDDLPDGDWDQQESQAGLEGLVPGGADDLDFDILPDACRVFEDAIGDLPALLGDASPLATASRTFTDVGQLLNLDALSATVVVFEEADGARDAAALLDAAFSADNLEGCIQAAIIPAGDDGLQIVEFSLTTPTYALSDSTALTASIEAIALILPVNVTIELHAFQRANVLALYVGVQINSERLSDEQAGLLATFVNRIEEAQTKVR